MKSYSPGGVVGVGWVVGVVFAKIKDLFEQINTYVLFLSPHTHIPIKLRPLIEISNLFDPSSDPLCPSDKSAPFAPPDSSEPPDPMILPTHLTLLSKLGKSYKAHTAIYSLLKSKVYSAV